MPPEHSPPSRPPATNLAGSQLVWHRGDYFLDGVKVEDGARLQLLVVGGAWLDVRFGLSPKVPRRDQRPRGRARPVPVLHLRAGGAPACATCKSTKPDASGDLCALCGEWFGTITLECDLVAPLPIRAVLRWPVPAEQAGVPAERLRGYAEGLAAAVRERDVPRSLDRMGLDCDRMEELGLDDRDVHALHRAGALRHLPGRV